MIKKFDYLRSDLEMFHFSKAVNKGRLNIRLSAEHRARLEARAQMAGYPSACALARCVLVAFLRYHQGGSPYPKEITAWIEEMAAHEGQ